MTFYVTNQNIVVASLAILGVLFGFSFDALTVARRLLDNKKSAVLARIVRIVYFFLDLLFCLAGCVLFIAVIYVTNYGYVRWYEFAAVAVGVWLYRAVFDYSIVRVLSAIVDGALYFLRKIVSLLTYPFRQLFCALCGILRRTLRLCYTLYAERRLRKFSKRLMKKQIKASKRGFDV